MLPEPIFSKSTGAAPEELEDFDEEPELEELAEPELEELEEVVDDAAVSAIVLVYIFVEDPTTLVKTMVELLTAVVSGPSVTTLV